MLLRLAWAVVCVILWPLYYLSLVVRFMIPYPLWPLSKAWKADEKFVRAFHSPPYLDRLRG